ALNAQNLELPAGALEAPAKDFTIRVARGYSTPEQFGELPVTPGGAPASEGASANATQPYVTRLSDIARVEEGPDEYRRSFRSNGKTQVGIGIMRQSTANDLDISRGVRAQLPDINRSLPAGAKLEMAVDYTTFTAHALQEVWITMGISMALV